MAAPVVISAGFFGASTAAIVGFYPDGIEEHDVLLVFGESANQTFPPPQFFDAENLTPYGASMASIGGTGTGTAGGAASTRLAAWWIRPFGLLDPLYFSAPGDHQVLAYALVRGAKTSGAPIEAVETSVAAAAAAEVSFPGLTTLGPERLVIQAVSWATDTAAAQVSGSANPDLAAFGEIFDVSRTNGNGGGCAAAGGTRAATGPVGAGSGALAVSSVQARISFAVVPAVAPPEAPAGGGGGSIWI